MRAAFIPALPPSALLAGMIAPSFRLVNRFCGKKLLRTYGPKGPPALCALFSRSPLAYVKGSLPFDRSLWHGPSVGRGGMRPFYILGYIFIHVFPLGVLYPRIYPRPCFSAKRCIS